jgi:hypothetical protein
LAIAGTSPSQIAKTLSAEGIPTPMTYTCTTKKSAPNSSLRRLWTHNKILDIIRDIRYTGVMTNGMYRVKEISSKIKCKTPKSEWFITENTHSAIVTNDEYEKAQLCIRKINRKPSTNIKKSRYTFPVKIRCGGCGHAMSKNNAVIVAYYCKHKSSFSDDSCFQGKIEYCSLKSILLESIQKLYELAGKKKTDTSKPENCDNATENLKQIQSIQKQIERFAYNKLSIYNQFSDGEISREDYQKQKHAIDSRIYELTLQSESKECYHCGQNADYSDNISDILEGLPYPAEYSDNVVKALVDYVVVHDENKVEIKWLFNDLSFSV